MGPAAVAKVFISYTSKDRQWAFWIAEALETLGHEHFVHEWELPAGGNIAQWMRERLDESDHLAAVVSAEYLTKTWSGWELDSTLWAAVGGRTNFVPPVFIEACAPPKLLAPHALAVAGRADEAGVAEPAARLFNQHGVLSDAKARWAEAEPLMRRALAIDEASFGADHPNTATARANLAALAAARDRGGPDGGHKKGWFARLFGKVP